jgi:hypothetical protein
MKQLIKINPLKLGLFFNHTYGKDRVTVRHALDELLEYHLQYKVKCNDGHYIDNSLQPRKDVVMKMVDDLNEFVKETIKLGDNMSNETWYKFTACVSEWENAQMKDDAGGEAQQVTKPKTRLPNKLNTPKAKTIFDRAIELGLIVITETGYYQWKDTKQLLAYYAEKMSEYLNLTNKLDKDGNKTTSWKPFEIIFDTKNLKDAKYGSWMKTNTKFTPTGFERIDKLFY